MTELLETVTLVSARRAAAGLAEILAGLDERSPRGAHRIKLRIQQVTG
ncbi:MULTISPECIES: hypothetical protein [Methylosinus]|nr:MULTISPECIES: hypothetical protein [Methylosinus]